MTRILLSIGSNIEPELNIRRCASSLAAHFENPIWSPVYRSAPVGMSGDDFLNAVVLTHSDQSIESLKLLLKTIEADHGRVRRTNKFISRTLDIDLLLYNTIVTEAGIDSTIHILKPLADLLPDEIYPDTCKSYQQLLEELLTTKPDVKNTIHTVCIDLSD